MSGNIWKYLFTVSLLACLFSCKKDSSTVPVTPQNFKLSYGDTVFYLNNQGADYIINPLQAPPGQYDGFPEGIAIDTKTGAINVSQSEKGLRYRITFLPDGSTDTVSTMLVISGINFLDGFYKLNTADSIALPLYNATKSNVMPGIGSGTLFDDGSHCNDSGYAVNVANGTINLAQTVRNGVFGTVPKNDDKHEFLLNYRVADKSGKALNALKVKVYYYDSISDVPQSVFDLIQSRNGTIFRTAMVGNPALGKPFGVEGNKPSKPRPPCIFILSK